MTSAISCVWRQGSVDLTFAITNKNDSQVAYGLGVCRAPYVSTVRHSIIYFKVIHGTDCESTHALHRDIDRDLKTEASGEICFR